MFYVYILLLFLQKEHQFSVMVNSTALFKLVGLGFNPHCLHVIFFDYVIIITLLVKHNWTPPDSAGLQFQVWPMSHQDIPEFESAGVCGGV